MRLGAGLAYYGLFAIVPLLSISLAVAGLVIDRADVAEALSELLGNVVDGDATAFSEELSAGIDATGTASGLGLFGLGSLMLTASLVFVALQDAFDTIWEVPVSRGWATVRRRFVAFAVVFLAGAVLVASFAVSTISNLITAIVPGNGALTDFTANVLASVGSAALMALVIALLFRYLTAHGLAWRVAFIGGGVTAIVLAIGNRLFVLYMQTVGSSSLLGATGSILVGIVWIYAIAQIILAGAELTRTLERQG